MNNCKVTLTKSLIGAKPKQKLTADSLGLKRPGDSIVCKNDAVLAGKVKLIEHLVKVENV
ncbi:MAG: 50S ribosomal protein L30 [Clostridia bacterium]|nr:50S ribosomal protein L30 [Clostridia bacterium]